MSLSDSRIKMSDVSRPEWTLEMPGRLLKCHDVPVPLDFQNHHLLELFEERIKEFSPDSAEARCGLYCFRPIFSNPLTKSIAVDDVLDNGAPISYYEKYEYSKMDNLLIRKDLMKKKGENINEHLDKPIPIWDFYNNIILQNKAPITTEGIRTCLTRACGDEVVPYKTDYMAGMDFGSMEELHWFRSALSYVGNVMPGINLPYFLVGGYSAFSTPHCEDAQVGSINWLLRGSRPCIWWGYETSNVHASLSQIIRNEVGGTNGFLYNILGYNYTQNCDALLKSKSFSFHPDVEFQTNGAVKVYTLVQPEGSVVITMPGAAHSVLSTGPKISSALNYYPSSTDGLLPDIDVQCKGHKCRGQNWFHSSNAEAVLRKELPSMPWYQKLYRSFLEHPCH